MNKFDYNPITNPTPNNPETLPTFHPCNLDEVLTTSTREAMRTNPDMPLVRGLILAELGVYVPDDVRGLLAVEQWIESRVPIVEDWVTWIDDQDELHSLPPCVNGPQGWEKLEPKKSTWDVIDPVDQRPAAPVNPEDHAVTVQVDVGDVEYGRVRYSQARVGRDDLKLTAGLLKGLAENAEDAEEFAKAIKAEISDFADRIEMNAIGDPEYVDIGWDPDHEEFFFDANDQTAVDSALEWLRINAPELHRNLTEE